MKKKTLIVAGIGALLASAAAIIFFRRKKGDDHEKPPKGAPQLNIENPGDQSEFTSSPAESDIG